MYFAGKCIFPSIEKRVKGSLNDNLLYLMWNNTTGGGGLLWLDLIWQTEWEKKCLLQSTKEEKPFW